MSEERHPNMVRTQELWDAFAQGQMVGLEELAEDLVTENGPGAGPWRKLANRDEFFTMAMHFIQFFQGTWKQKGTCVYGDDRCSITMVHETGTAPSGDEFDNMAIWVSRFNSDGKADRIWTVDLDSDAVVAFWDRNLEDLERSISG